jgi:hypothetical protein
LKIKFYLLKMVFMKNMLTGNKVPGWIVVFILLTSLMWMGLSFGFLMDGDWTMAVRNVTAPMVGLIAVFMARNFIPMFIAAVLGRLLMEFWDMMAIFSGQNPDASMQTMIIVMLLIEVAALAYLVKAYMADKA